MNQPLPLREQLKALEQLQEIDLKIDQLKKNKNSLPAALKTVDDAMNKARSLVETKKTAIGEIDKTLRQTRAALDLNRDRLNRSTSRLESVQNSQEYQAVQKEVEQARKLELTLQEQIKKSEADLATANGELTGLSDTFEKHKAERETQASALSGQSGEFDSQINGLMSQRGQFTSQVEPRILASYDRVRGARAGLGIAPAVGGRCKACNMMVPPQMFNEIQKGNVVHQCPSCHRILFVPVQGSSAEAK